MRAWRVGQPGPMRSGPLVADECPDPIPGPGEVLLKVRACGVCRTDLHLAEGDLAPRHPGVIPGHEVVGEVVACGPRATRFSPGDRIGAAWLGGTCGVCRFCLRGQENLCLSPLFTGWDRDGGYAELMTVAEDFAYRLPSSFPDEKLRPCCARASSATARFPGPSCRSAAGSEFTALAGQRIWRHRSPSTGVPACT